MSTVKPKTEYVASFSSLCGGLNLWDPDYAMNANESPEMQNLLWRNGMLCSRRGQTWLSSETLGTGYTAYHRLWHEHIFAHIGDGLYAFPAASAAEDSEVSPALLCSGIPEIRGTFFVYGEHLFYKTRGAYKQIAATAAAASASASSAAADTSASSGTSSAAAATSGSSLSGTASASAWTFTCTDVTPYVPVVVINAAPESGAGDLYQPENRLSPRKTIWFNAASGVTMYYLPVKATRIISVTVDGVVQPGTKWSYNSGTGMIRFSTAPPVTDPPTNNTVRITYELANADAYKTVDDCRYAEVYGGTGALCIVLAGSTAQPNLMVWNGQDSFSMNPGYFPLEQYQLCGDADERILGFGKQQSNLIIFKEHSVGKTTLGTTTVNDRLYIDMPYTPVNARTGCSFPWSIQLVENNLVWANKEGIYTMLGTTAADENAIVCISRKVNGSAWRSGGGRSSTGSSATDFAAACTTGSSGISRTSGLLSDLAFAGEDAVCSADDGKKYFLTAGSRTFVWDYELSIYSSPAWFLLTNTAAIAYITEDSDPWHLNAAGQLTATTDTLSDYGEGIDRVFRFATVNFGSYDTLKNVNSVIVTLGALAQSNTTLQYLTDYELRADLTNLQVIPANEYEKDRVPGTRPVRDLIPAVFRRRPMCRRVLHFALRLENKNSGDDLEIISAQVFYNLQGRLR